MKRKLLFIIATVFLVAACHNDDYMPGLPAPGNEDNETEMAEQVAGRVALGYVTYYGTSIPDAKYLTHINYAFAELYVKNGIYEKFGLQGDKSRFDKVKKIKSQYPHVKILLSLPIAFPILTIPRTEVSPPWRRVRKCASNSHKTAKPLFRVRA